MLILKTYAYSNIPRDLENYMEKTQHLDFLDLWEDLEFQVCMTNFNIVFF